MTKVSLVGFKLFGAPLAPRIWFNYRNWKGEMSSREVIVHHIFWGETEWHPEPQWLMTCTDVQKHDIRTFAMKDMSDVRDSKPRKQKA